MRNPFLPPAVQAAMDAEGIESFGLQKVGSRLGELNPGLDTEARNVFTSYSWQVGFDWNTAKMQGTAQTLSKEFSPDNPKKDS